MNQNGGRLEECWKWDKFWKERFFYSILATLCCWVFLFPWLHSSNSSILAFVWSSHGLYLSLPFLPPISMLSSFFWSICLLFFRKDLLLLASVFHAFFSKLSWFVLFWLRVSLLPSLLPLSHAPFSCDADVLSFMVKDILKSYKNFTIKSFRSCILLFSGLDDWWFFFRTIFCWFYFGSLSKLPQYSSHFQCPSLIHPSFNLPWCIYCIFLSFK